MYKCECGREFNTSQEINGHKAYCEVYRKLKYEESPEEYLNYKNNLLKARKDALNIGRETKNTNCKEVKKSKLQNWLSEQHICENCGKLMTTKYASGRFCSKECAHSRNHSKESRLKVSNTLKEKYALGELVPKGWTPESIKKAHETVRKNKSLKCTSEYILEDSTIPNVVDSIPHRKPGWQSRVIKNSYPEQFWMKVFDNNNIEYIREFSIPNGMTSKKAANFKLDFLINGVCDIEIDGSQHLDTDIQLKDIRRDEYLKSLGYIVYRIPWINPNSNNNKKLVKQQIDCVLDFIKNHSI